MPVGKSAPGAPATSRSGGVITLAPARRSRSLKPVHGGLVEEDDAQPRDRPVERFAGALEVYLRWCREIEDATHGQRSDEFFLCGARRRLTPSCRAGERDRRERAAEPVRAQRCAFERIHCDVELEILLGAQLLSVEQHRGFVLGAFADHGAADAGACESAARMASVAAWSASLPIQCWQASAAARVASGATGSRLTSGWASVRS